MHIRSSFRLLVLDSRACAHEVHRDISQAMGCMEQAKFSVWGYSDYHTIQVRLIYPKISIAPPIASYPFKPGWNVANADQCLAKRVIAGLGFEPPTPGLGIK